MFPGMGGVDPKMMKQAMKQMGVKQTEIDAVEVIIKTKDKELVISNPNVMKVEMMGQESLQITGDIEERELGPSEDDVKMVMEQASVSSDKAKKALAESNGDIAEAIIKAKE